MNEKTKLKNNIRWKKWYAKNKDRFKAYVKKRYDENRDEILIQCKVYRKRPEVKKRKKEWDKMYAKKHSEKIKAYKKKYYSDFVNKAKAKEYQKAYREKNWKHLKKYHCQYKKKRFKEDLSFKLHHYITKQIKNAIHEKPIAKKWSDILGYGCDELRIHLQKQFKQGMSWDNYGKIWHIDHRIPISWCKEKDDLLKIKTVWILENLQPKFAKENISKGNRFAEPTLKQLRGIINGSF